MCRSLQHSTRYFISVSVAFLILTESNRSTTSLTVYTEERQDKNSSVFEASYREGKNRVVKTPKEELIEHISLLTGATGLHTLV